MRGLLGPELGRDPHRPEVAGPRPLGPASSRQALRWPRFCSSPCRVGRRGPARTRKAGGVGAQDEGRPWRRQRPGRPGAGMAGGPSTPRTWPPLCPPLPRLGGPVPRVCAPPAALGPDLQPLPERKHGPDFQGITGRKRALPTHSAPIPSPADSQTHHSTRPLFLTTDVA